MITRKFFLKKHTLRRMAMTVSILSACSLAVILNQLNGRLPESGSKALASSKRLIWQHDLLAGLASARAEKKLVLVDLYTSWCGWCKRLDRDTFSNADVVDLMQRQFVCVKLNAEDGAEGQSFARQHKVKAFPCVIVMAPSGQVRRINYGYLTAREFSALMTEIINNKPLDTLDTNDSSDVVGNEP